MCAIALVLRIALQDGMTALMYAAHEGHTECVRQLIDAGADKEAMTSVRVGRCLAGRFFELNSFPCCTS